MNNYLCETCLNKDETFIPNGNTYVLKEICIYNKNRFPLSVKCSEYKPEEDIDDETW